MRHFLVPGALLALMTLAPACKKDTGSSLVKAEGDAIEGQAPASAPVPAAAGDGSGMKICEEQVKGLGLNDGDLEESFGGNVVEGGNFDPSTSTQESPSPEAPATPKDEKPKDEKPKDEKASRTGEMDLQLAPSFFEKMSQCGDNMPDVSTVGDGKINADGDCEYPGAGGLPFISCHYHLGVEFASSNQAQRPGHGEIHCIFPSGGGPVVFGGYFQCSNSGKKPAQVSHDKFAGATCGSGLLKTLKTQYDACASKNCCDDGTLTGVLDKRKKKNALIETVNRATKGNLANGLGVRPDFRICGEPMKLDCDDLAMWTGHTANAPAFGGETDKEFAPTFSETAEKRIKDEKASRGSAVTPH